MSLIRIEKLFNFEKGALQSSKCTPGKYPFLTASSEWKTHNRYTHDCEALVFAAAASGSLGRTHYVNGQFIASDLCFIITAKDPRNFPIDLRFYQIVFNELKEDIVKNTKAGTSKEAISLGSFGRYELPYFDIERQREVKSKFVKAEQTKSNLSNELTRQLDLVKQLRQAFLREAMQGKLVPQDPNDEPASELLKRIKAEKEKLIREGKLKKEKPLPPIRPEEIPFEIPKGWVWCRLGEACTTITKGSSPKWQGISYVDSAEKGILFITSKNVDSYNIDLSAVTYVEKRFNDIEPRSVLKKNDLLTNIVGASIGRTALYDSDKVANINQAVCLMRIEHNLINKRYILHLMNSSFVIQLMMDSQFAPGRANLSMSDISKFGIPLPPLSEQDRIEAKLKQLLHCADLLDRNIKQSQDENEQLLKQVLREALMQ